MTAEQALAQHVIDWLEAQHWDVYQEVPLHGGGSKTADIVAVRNGLVWVIECKTTLSLAVMAQASSWNVHLRSIAVPWAKRGYDERNTAERICRNFLQVGVLYVHEPDRYSGVSRVEESTRAILLRHNHRFAIDLRDRLKPEGAGASWSAVAQVAAGSGADVQVVQ